ncbi:unnamed protein product [Moneuplotes crassus]|uniref:Uncharacterized protein n=1 Tax=Euplotes crassus TaxID=5936 RepID=A0AAD1XA50_EUPCR|nr:unnamed protein product [Moneuplotes crassus]
MKRSLKIKFDNSEFSHKPFVQQLWDKRDHCSIRILETAIFGADGKLKQWFFSNRKLRLLKKHAANTSIFTLENAFIKDGPKDPEMCAIKRSYPPSVLEIQTQRDISKTFDSSKHPPMIISYDDFQKICHRALLPSLSSKGNVISLQLMIKPAMDALYRVIYVENIFINEENDQMDCYECYSTSFKSAFGLEEVKSHPADAQDYTPSAEYMDLINENTEKAKTMTSHLINEALETKLKKTSDEVIKYIKKFHKINSASLEFIMDSQGLLYLINLETSNASIKKRAARSNRRIRLQSSKIRRNKFSTLRLSQEGSREQLRSRAQNYSKIRKQSTPQIVPKSRKYIKKQYSIDRDAASNRVKILTSKLGSATKMINYIHKNQNRKDLFNKDVQEEIKKVNQEMQLKYDKIKKEKDFEYQKIQKMADVREKLEKELQQVEHK